jgi:hypothetical protein
LIDVHTVAPALSAPIFRIELVMLTGLPKITISGYHLKSLKIPFLVIGESQSVHLKIELSELTITRMIWPFNETFILLGQVSHICILHSDLSTSSLSLVRKLYQHFAMSIKSIATNIIKIYAVINIIYFCKWDKRNNLLWSTRGKSGIKKRPPQWFTEGV